MRIIIIIFFLFMSFFVGAQSYDITYVYTKSKMTVSNNLSPKLYREINDLIARTKKVFKLHYVNGRSKCYLDHVLVNGEIDPDPRKMTGYGIFYKDFQKRCYINVADGIGKDVAVREQFDEMFNWQIDESRDTVILGFKCNRATTMYAGYEIVAWFSKSIPIMDGPLKYAGLPGLILRTETTFGVLEMTDIQINKNSKEEIIIPVMKKYISFEEFRESNILTIKGKRIKRKKSKP